MAQKNIYERIVELYKEDIGKWREFMYNNMWLLMRKNPLLRNTNPTFTKDDILSEAFMIWDVILLREDISDKKKISKLWFLFNRWRWELANRINQYNLESYTIDDVWENKSLVSYVEDDALDYILVSNNIITPLEAKILAYVKQGRWKYEIARLLKTTYYNVKQIIETLTLKINRFISEQEIDADNSKMSS